MLARERRPGCGKIEQPPIAQLAEAGDLKSLQSGFESLWGDCARAAERLPPRELLGELVRVVEEQPAEFGDPVRGETGLDPGERQCPRWLP